MLITGRRSRPLRPHSGNRSSGSGRLFVLTTVALLAGALTGGRSPAIAQDAVPARHQALYSYLSSVLDGTRSYVDLNQPAAPAPLVFGAELQQANGNRGQGLLDPRNLPATSLSLDRLQQLGVQGVTIAVKFPLYTSADPNFEGYRGYFTQVAADVHRRGMTLDVEATVLFAGTVFTPETVSFAGLTLEQFEQQDRQMVQDIITDMAPDYLMLIDEPSTEASLTGISELNDPAHELQLVSYLLDGLNRGSTLIGGGAGSWESPDFVRLLAENTTLDYIGVHIYPLSAQFVQNALTMAQLAHQNGKRVAIEETWLYKTTPSESPNGIAANAQIFQRDTYSFFAPLDQEYLYDVVGLAHIMGAEYISPFWSGYFFSYAEYTSAADSTPYRQWLAPLNQTQFAGIVAGTFTSTGTYYSNLICQNTPGCSP